MRVSGARRVSVFPFNHLTYFGVRPSVRWEPQTPLSLCGCLISAAPHSVCCSHLSAQTGEVALLVQCSWICFWIFFGRSVCSRASTRLLITALAECAGGGQPAPAPTWLFLLPVLLAHFACLLLSINFLIHSPSSRKKKQKTKENRSSMSEVGSAFNL